MGNYVLILKGKVMKETKRCTGNGAIRYFREVLKLKEGKVYVKVNELETRKNKDGEWGDRK